MALPSRPRPSSSRLFTSTKVGLHPQLVGFDPIKANGLLVGFNPPEVSSAFGSAWPRSQRNIEFYWYAGELRRTKPDFRRDRSSSALPISLPRIPCSSRNLAWSAP